MKQKQAYLIRNSVVIGICVILLVLSACGSSDEVTSEKPRLEATAPQADINELVTGNNEFAFDLYKSMGDGEENLFFSPYSISQALAMVYAGAQGQTAQQMANTMHFNLPQERLHPAFNALDLDLRKRSQTLTEEPASRETPEPGFELNIANSVWAQKGYSYLPEFLDVLAQDYGSGLELVDIRQSPEKVVKEINRWVNQETRGRISEIVGRLSPDTGLVLANAIYFNAKWELPFDETRTKEAPFYLLSGETIKTLLMHQTSDFQYTEGEGFQAIKLPYIEPSFSMVVILPEIEKFRKIESELNNEWVHEIVNNFKTHEVILSMPKFRLDTPAMNIKESLSEMGMPAPFTPDANFSGIIRENYPISLGAVLHKAYIDVNEKKTEAAAATIVIVTVEVSIGQDKPEPIIMKIDHPFIFIIRDNRTNTILFVGRMMNPLE